MPCSFPSPVSGIDSLTKHASVRMSQRHITLDDVTQVLNYGRVLYAKGAVYHIVGRREIEQYRGRTDLQHLDGVHVVCSQTHHVLTVYRNRTFHTKSLRDVSPHRRGR